MTAASLARHIDHSALKPETTEAEITALCNQAHEHRFATVCVMPYYIPFACRVLEELSSDVVICAPIGFPNGAHHSVVKAAEARKAIHDGARELDMVMNIGALKSGHQAVVMADILAVTMEAHQQGCLVKVILETALLTDDEKRLACELATRGHADFVKTSTGFNGGGATVEDVRLLRSCIDPGMRVKASGGIRNYETAISMIESGAQRIGTSASIEILAGAA